MKNHELKQWKYVNCERVTLNIKLCEEFGCDVKRTEDMMECPHTDCIYWLSSAECDIIYMEYLREEYRGYTD